MTQWRRYAGWAARGAAVALLLVSCPNERLAAQEQETAREYYQEGVFYGKQGKYEEAAMSLEKAVALEPGNADARNALGVIYHRQKQYQQAEEQYLEAIKANPNHAKARTNLAITYQQQHEPQKALQQLEKALEIQPGYAPAQALIEQVRKQAKKQQEAERKKKEKAERAEKLSSPKTEKSPKSEKPPKREASERRPAAGLFDAGTSFIRQGKVDAGIDAYLQGLKQSPNSAEGYALLGLAYREKYRITHHPQWRQQELIVLEKAAQMHPPHLPALLSLAEFYYEQGNLSSALALFQQVIEQQPNFPARDQIENILRPEQTEDSFP